MKRLSADGFRSARDHLRTRARPLERALFAHEFEGAPRESVLAELAAYRNPDGGFGRALEPDLRLPSSSALATLTGLDLLRDLGVGGSEPLVRGALAWLVERFDPDLPGWRCVPPEVDAFPHAPHWSWALHAPGGPWDPLVIPGARLSSHFSHWREAAPASIAERLTGAFVRHVTQLTREIGPDGLVYAASVENDAVRARMRELARANVSRDPSTWTSYCAKPLKLAPTPDSPLAECLVSEVALNLDWEIDQQAADGSWQPNWTWQGLYPEVWPVARREWQGELTLRTLRSLRAWGRLAGA